MAKASCVREVYCRKNTGFGAKKQGFQTFISCVALANYLTSLSLRFLIYFAGLLGEQIGIR